MSMVRRAAGVVLLGLGLVALGGPARGQYPDRTQPPPAPGVERLIRLGPQEMVSEDAHGNISKVDEPEPTTVSKGQAIGSAFGQVGGGVGGLIIYDGQDSAAAAAYGAGLPFEGSETPSSATERRRLPDVKPAETPP